MLASRMLAGRETTGRSVKEEFSYARRSYGHRGEKYPPEMQFLGGRNERAYLRETEIHASPP